MNSMMTSGNMSNHDLPLVDVNVTSFDREYLHWSLIIVEVGAVVVIVIGDISMLMMFFTRKLLGQSTNILVFSVAIGDLVTGLLTLPLAMLQKILVEPSEFLCKGYFYFANVSKTAVGYTILLLAMERIIAVLIHTFRILPPGRCLFFASLTWFFAAAYNIWSVVIYDVEVVTLTSIDPPRHMFLCLASRRFMYLHDIFEVLNPLVTFTFPALCSCLLFGYFLWKKHEADKPGRPYKSSKSVVVFTFALLVSFTASQLPWEIATVVLQQDAGKHPPGQLVTYKVLHLISFSRGFWDIFIFGAFRHYVCKKEKALAHFREQRSMHVQRSNLAIPVLDRPLSTSLLDSDPSVSRRYSSDIPSRRPSALDEAYSKCLQPDSRPEGVPQSLLQTLNRPDEEQTVNGNYSSTIITTTTTTSSSSSPYHLAPTTTTTAPSTHEETIVVITQGYLMPRSPCVSSDNNSLFQFPPRIVDGVHYRIDRSSSYGGNATGSCHSLDKGDEQTDRVAVEYLPGIPGKTPFSFRRKSCGDKAHHSFLALKAGLNSCAMQNKQNLTTTAEVSTLLENEDENCPPVGPDHPAPPLSLDVHNHDVSTNTTNEEIPSVVDLLSAADQDSPLAETDSADSRNSPEERAPQSIPSSAAIASAGPVSHSNLSPKYDSLELPLGHLERPKTLAAHSSPQRAVSHETLSLPFSPSRTLSSFPKMSRVNETFSFSLSSAGPTTKPSSPIVKRSTSSLSPMTNTTTATSATPNSPTIKRSTTSLSPMDNTTSTTSRSHSLTAPVDRPSSLLSPLFQRSPSLTPTSGGGHSNNAAPSLGHRSLSVRSVPAATATVTAATTAASSVRGSSSSNTLLVPSPLPSRRPDSSASSKSSPLPPLSLTPLPPFSPLTPRLPCVLD